MGKIKKVIWTLILCHFIFIPGVCFGDEMDLFSYSASPDALILLDLSGSMDQDPQGNDCWSSGCSKLAMAKNAIFAILDDNGDGTINSTDETSLRIRIGYMRYYNCNSDESPLNYSSGCNTLIVAIPSADPPPFSSPSTYSNIWSKVNAENANGGTPLASALNEAKLYLDAHKAADSGSACRQKFVILITDGEDTLACNGDGTETQSDQYKRRKASVAAANALNQAGYKVFVIGFGAKMPTVLQNTLNWMAYYGGTNNPSVTDSGNKSAITPSSNACAVDSSNDPGNSNLSGYAFIATDPNSLSDALSRAFNYISNSRVSFTASTVAAFRTTAENFLYQASFQPINGDPFWLGHIQKYNINSDGSVGSMVWDAGSLLQSRGYSNRKIFTLISGAVVPFSDSSGTFSPSGQGKTYLGVGTGDQAQAIVQYIEGNYPSYNPDGWYLGDIFHSSVMSIGSPSPYFTDIYSPQAFANFQSNNASREKIVLVGANDGQFHAFSASDGSEKWSFIPPNQLPRLAFIAHQKEPTTLTHKYFVDGGTSAADIWLGSGDGKTKSSSDWHTLLVFGEGKGVRDSTNKYPNYQWSSSSTCDSQNPSSDFTKAYDSSHQYYCGYYAFDVTNTSANPPVFKWHLNFPIGGPQTQQYLGEPWSKMAIGRVKISGSEKWVGFIGGGYATEADRGKGFFVVDLSDGHVLWSYTKANNSSMDYVIPASPAIVDTDLDGFIDTAYVGDLGGNMWRFKFCKQTDTSCDTGSWNGGLLFQASSGRPIYTAAAVARDSSSLWIFWGTGDKEIPLSTSGTDKFFGIKDNDRTTTYTISNLQDISTAGTTYSDPSKNGWYITLAGTGEKDLADPTVFGGIVMFTTYTPDTSDSNPCSRVGAAKLYGIAMMQVPISGYKYDPGAGVLSTPSSPSSTAGGARSVTLGTGMAKEPVVSQKPAPGGATDLYISVSGGIGVGTSIVSDVQLGSTPLTDRLKTTAPSTQILHWKDGRVQ
ncbi:MAG: PilC/PilY family type IV pilus protein [Thermodesulfobacteriota bacterium]